MIPSDLMLRTDGGARPWNDDRAALPSRWCRQQQETATKLGVDAGDDRTGWFRFLAADVSQRPLREKP